MKNIDWEILVKLYETRSITRAAEALYMTQPALTKRLKKIEREWNVEIVKRHSQGVIFTEEGKYLVQKAGIMLDFLEEIRTHLADCGEVKELLKIGVPNSFARLHMPELFKAYTERFDRLQILTVSSSSDLLVQQLMEGSIDIGFICGDYPYLGEKTCLFEEALYVVAPREIKADEIEHLPLVKSYFNPLVSMTINQWWKNRFGTLPHEAYSVPYSDIAIEMVEKGLGITFLFGSNWKINEEKVQLIPIYDKKGEPVTRKVWLMLSERCLKSQDIMDFVSLAEEFYRANLIWDETIA